MNPSRREFLKYTAAAVAGAFLSGCEGDPTAQQYPQLNGQEAPTFIDTTAKRFGEFKQDPDYFNQCGAFHPDSNNITFVNPQVSRESGVCAYDVVPGQDPEELCAKNGISDKDPFIQNSYHQVDNGKVNFSQQVMCDNGETTGTFTVMEGTATYTDEDGDGRFDRYQLTNPQ